MKIIILFIYLFLFHFTYAEDWILDTCSVTSELTQCIESNKNWDPRNIQDFVCLSSNNSYEILLQIILDKEFKKIDKDVETYLAKLEDNKNEFFWPESTKSLLEWIDEIESKFSLYDEGSFWKRYMENCWIWLIAKASECFSSIPSIHVEKYFQESTCKALVITKLEVFKGVSYDILKLNKWQVAKDEKKKNTQKRRTKYDKLLEIISMNIWYLDRIWKKWPSTTKNPHK